MSDESQSPDVQQPLELAPDHSYESRREFVEKLAYQLWEQRGSPLGSPEEDWFAAERTVYASLAASGMIAESQDDRQNMGERIYR